MREFLSQVSFNRVDFHTMFMWLVQSLCRVCLEGCPISHLLFWALSEPWTWWSVLAPDKKDLRLIYVHSLGFARYKEHLKERILAVCPPVSHKACFQLKKFLRYDYPLLFLPTFDVLFQVIWIPLQKPKSILGHEVCMEPLNTMFKVTFKNSKCTLSTAKNRELKPCTIC